MFAEFAQAVVQSPWDWSASHIHLLGWPTLCLLAWRVGKYFQAIASKFERTVTQIDTMATNHFPHMETSLAKQDVYLESIDKNIARLADKMM